MKNSAHLLFLCFAMLSAVSPCTPPNPLLRQPRPTFWRVHHRSISPSVSFVKRLTKTNPTLPLDEFRAIDGARDTPNLTRAASKINENLYASTALERGTLKIKSNADHLAADSGPEQKAAKAKALEYMSAVLQAFTPALTKKQSQQKLQKLLVTGKNKRYYTETEGAVRYVVADNGEKGLTFAVEPIKLALSDTLGGAN
ncbi:Protein of uncharacterised function (DUF1454) [Enterobacter cloacae]|uniref:Protein of uncharacterized function (DUF1454) n=1 Tax=Enterobacter cloacae TaxID=550 RepID=A0A377LQF2_ENTCL|nr:Protein of uncharacterised function (DUF1454) [Enterobacter cloacae]